MNVDEKTLARAAQWGVGAFVFIMFVAFVFIQPELNPLQRFGSEYAAGRHGWLMKLAFYLCGAGLIAFAAAMAKGLPEKARSPVGIALVAVGGLGIFMSGVFDSALSVLNDHPPPRWVEPANLTVENIIHIVTGLVAFVAFMPGAGMVSRRLRRAGRLRGGYRWLQALSWLIPLLFIALIAVFEPNDLAGLGQRIFLLCLFGWVWLAAQGLKKSAFT